MLELPQGTVTFLFTDIEGSTRLWERFPEEMKPLLAQHDTLLRSCVEPNHGAVVKTTGDGCHAVFARAHDGIAAALAAQRALAEASWDPTIGQLLVRMGLHTGAAGRTEKATHELARDYLVGIATGVREKGISVQGITVEGSLHEGIVFCAESEQVDLIVICTRGYSGLSRLLMGSVADRVVRGAGVPVLLVSTRQEEVEKDVVSTKTLIGTP